MAQIHATPGIHNIFRCNQSSDLVCQSNSARLGTVTKLFRNGQNLPQFGNGSLVHINKEDLLHEILF